MLRKSVDDFFVSFREMWHYDKVIFLILFLDMLIESVLPFPTIILSGRIVDSLANRDAFLHIIYAVGIMFGTNLVLFTLHTALKKCKEFRSVKFSQYIDYSINEKCLNIDYEQLNDTAFQDKAYFTNQMAQSNNYLSNLMNGFEVIAHFASLIGVIVLIGSLNVWLILIAVAMIMMQTGLYYLQLLVSRRYNSETIYEKRKMAYASQLTREISAIKDIQIFDMTGFVLEKISLFQADILKCEKRRIGFSWLIDSGIYGISVVFQVVSYIVLGKEVLWGTISIGDFTKGVSSFVNLASISLFITSYLLTINDSRYYLRKFRSFLNTKSKFDMHAKVSTENFDTSNIQIEFRNVSFRYPNSTTYVLKNINITIKNGESLALVGCNGAGKTSFALLLARMYDPTEGNIYLNGIDIKNIDYREYLKLISTVYQDYSLFAFSIGENIAGYKELTDEDKCRVDTLIDRNGLRERINKLYRGIDTPITKALDASGVDFSGGERQKIALVRALYKEAPILILDEPTSALDAMAEEDIYKSFSQITKGKTTLYISHRMFGTCFCDHIAVLNEGEIIEYGTYDELMNLRGMFFKLMKRQKVLS